MELQEGQKVEFTYQGSQDGYDKRQVGTVVMVPEIRWQGGTVPGLEERGYALDIQLLEDK